jgi:antitoxin component of MazEF toxin-antitoxin module
MEAKFVPFDQHHSALIFPNEILQELGLSSNSLVHVTFADKQIIIKQKPREGWEAAAKKAHQMGDDKNVFEDDSL